jgi:hypothetical protein
MGTEQTVTSPITSVSDGRGRGHLQNTENSLCTDTFDLKDVIAFNYHDGNCVTNVLEKYVYPKWILPFVPSLICGYCSFVDYQCKLQ